METFLFLLYSKAVQSLNEKTETKCGINDVPPIIVYDEESVDVSESKQHIDSDHSEHSEHEESKRSNSEAADANNADSEQQSKSPDSRSSDQSQSIIQPPALYQTLEQSSDNSDNSSNNRTIESSQNNSFSDNSQIVPNTVDEQPTIIKDDQPDDQLSDHHPDDQLNDEINDHINHPPDERDQNDNLPSPPSTPSSDDTASIEPPKSCLSSRRCSSKSSIKKKVNYSDSKEYMPMATDDDEVFSDSISPQLPRGDMCTPYPKKKGSLPGMSFPSDWFPDDR